MTDTYDAEKNGREGYNVAIQAMRARVEAEKTTNALSFLNEERALALADALDAELAHVKTIHQAEKIIADADYIRDLCKKARLQQTTQNRFAKNKNDAIRMIGRELDKIDKHKGGRPTENPSHDGRGFPTFKELGFENYNKPARYQLAASLPDDKYEDLFAQCQQGEREFTFSGVLSLAKRLKRMDEDGERHISSVGRVEIRKQDALEFLASPQLKGMADLLLTDPPYMTDVEDINAFARSWLAPALRTMKTSGRAYIFTGAYPQELAAYLNAINELLTTGEFSELTLDNVLVWTYRNTMGPSPRHGYKLNWQACFYLYGPDAAPLDCPKLTEQFTVQDINAPDARTGVRYHAWQKPDEIAERFIQHSTKEGDLIIDPFCGTGTFAAAAARLGRNAIAAEISDDMLALCQERGLHVDSP